MTSLPQPLKKTLEELLMQRITGFSPATGGCINHGGQLTTTSSSYFLKWNNAQRYPDMFVLEARGLNILADARCITIPAVHHVGEADGMQFIVMEFIHPAPRKKNYFELLGQRLAALHNHSQSQFGLDHHNYIGSLPQQNTPADSWVEFFVKQRLRPQLEMALQSYRLHADDAKKFDTLFLRLNELLPEDKPSLLHGDLWSGNLMVDDHGEPCLIDPAVYYGHREAEIAFTQLFGGFDEAFYQAYQEAFPLLPGFASRVDIYNLYPLLVHVNLFGGGYSQSVRSILKRLS
jgi:fructosamine-3-kinase